MNAKISPSSEKDYIKNIFSSYCKSDLNKEKCEGWIEDWRLSGKFINKIENEPTVFYVLNSNIFYDPDEVENYYYNLAVLLYILESSDEVSENNNFGINLYDELGNTIINFLLQKILYLCEYDNKSNKIPVLRKFIDSLLNLGADFQSPNFDGKAPLDFVKEINENCDNILDDLSEILKEKGAKEILPIIEAAKKNDITEMIKLWPIETKYNQNIVDIIFRIAFSENNKNLIEFLRERDKNPIYKLFYNRPEVSKLDDLSKYLISKCIEWKNTNKLNLEEDCLRFIRNNFENWEIIFNFISPQRENRIPLNPTRRPLPQEIISQEIKIKPEEKKSWLDFFKTKKIAPTGGKKSKKRRKRKIRKIKL
jgi:hypothetical protein